MGRHMHVCFAIESLKENWKYLKVVEDGKERPATKREVLEAYKAAKAKGYDVLPACNNIDERGHCLGHEDGEGMGDVWDAKIHQQTSLVSFAEEDDIKKSRGACLEWRQE